MSKFVTASHPQRGTLWAAVDASTHHLEGRIAERRFAAFLAPFSSVPEAEAALTAAGARLEGSSG
jgi:hypothetical protein